MVKTSCSGSGQEAARYLNDREKQKKEESGRLKKDGKYEEISTGRDPGHNEKILF